MNFGNNNSLFIFFDHYDYVSANSNLLPNYYKFSTIKNSYYVYDVICNKIQPSYSRVLVPDFLTLYYIYYIRYANNATPNNLVNNIKYENILCTPLYKQHLYTLV